MKKLYDLAVSTGTYQKDGETKNRYENIGSIMENDNGKFIIMNRTFNPAGVPNPENRSTIIVSMFAPKGNQTAPNGSGGVQSAFSGQQVDNPFADDQVPF